MISLKKFLSMNTDAEKTLMHVIRLLVDGIGQHFVTADSADAARFRKSIVEVSESLEEHIAPAELLILAGSVVQALEDHTSRTTREQQMQTSELQLMVKMLAATVSAVSASGHTSVVRLGEIEQQMAKVSALDDVRTIKARLADCLSDIRIEAKRQQKETGATIEQLTQGLDEARRSTVNIVSGVVQDNVTGLQARADAEAALAEPARPGGQTFVAVLVLERQQTVTRRFGKEVGDELLAEFARLLRKALPSEDRMYRWGGPTLLALMTRPATLDRIRSEVMRVLEARWEHDIKMQSRTVMLPITARWVVFPLMAAPRLLYHKIDVFAATPTPND